MPERVGWVKRLWWVFHPFYTLERTCAWCGATYVWEGEIGDSPSSFCGKTHKTAASRARAKRYERAQDEDTSRKIRSSFQDIVRAGKCPTPAKKSHTSVRAAQEACNRVDPSMRPYLCPCGNIHIGH